MASKNSIYECRKAHVATVKGRLLEPASAYGRWAYWCGGSRDGWRSAPCHCGGKDHRAEAMARRREAGE